MGIKNWFLRYGQQSALVSPSGAPDQQLCNAMLQCMEDEALPDSATALRRWDAASGTESEVQEQ